MHGWLVQVLLSVIIQWSSWEGKTQKTWRRTILIHFGLLSTQFCLKPWWPSNCCLEIGVRPKFLYECVFLFTYYYYCFYSFWFNFQLWLPVSSMHIWRLNCYNVTVKCMRRKLCNNFKFVSNIYHRRHPDFWIYVD